jgi:hypothetical protein
MPLLIKCISGSDEQTQFCALSLVHAITYRSNWKFILVSSHSLFFDCKGLEVVLGAVTSKFYQNHLYMVEIIGILCSDRNINLLSAEYSAVGVEAHHSRYFNAIYFRNQFGIASIRAFGTDQSSYCFRYKYLIELCLGR